jgi:hypothetical protein
MHAGADEPLGVGRVSTAYVREIGGAPQSSAAGVEAGGSTPEDLAATVTSEIARWSSVIRHAGIRAE